ncbi:MAG: helix-turn-helix transcriptional regulator [candidate division Zixibacteria bacterium]
MKWLSRKEEFVMLAVKALGEDAYGVSIKLFLDRATGKRWSIGATYDVLDRLMRKKCLSSKTSGPTPERGGKSKRLYLITDQGQQALIELREMQKAMQMKALKPVLKTGDMG